MLSATDRLLLDPVLVDEVLERGVSLESLMKVRALNEWAAELNASAEEYAQMPTRLDAMRGQCTMVHSATPPCDRRSV